VVGFNTVVDAETAQAMADLFIEVVVAPRVQPEALAVFSAKKNLRVVELPVSAESGGLDFKTVRGGILVQDRFHYEPNEADWKVVSKRQPTDAERFDLSFAWAAVATVKSNAILLARDGQVLGIGAGQMSRVDSSFLAVHKAKLSGHDVAGAALASDAFFPFPDGVEEAAAAGVRAIIQPGGSVNDEKVIAAADAHDIAMIFTGRRQFRH